jgi:phospholipase/carboxylesterase
VTRLRAVTSPDWPSPEEPSPPPVMILLHGYGSHEHDLAGLAPMLPGGIAWASPRAPLEMGYGAAAWFPLADLESEPAPGPVADATEALWEWIDEAAPKDAPIVAVGFSQGGFMALQLLRTRPERLVGTVVLAGFTTGAPQPADAQLSATRPEVLWCRGDADQVVAGAMVRRTATWMGEHATVREHVYPGLAHGIDERMMNDVRAYIDSAVAAAEH